MNKFSILSLIFLFVLISCEKNEQSQSTKDVVIAKDVEVINNQTWNDNFISIDSTNYTLTFSPEISLSQSIKPGNIIISTIGEGLLRKVKTINNVNNQIQIQTDPIFLTEVIQQGLIEFNQELTTSMVKTIDYHYSGVYLKANKSKGLSQSPLEWEINTVLYDADNNPSTTIDQIKVLGSFSCDWKINAKIDVGITQGLKEAKFGFESSENLNLKLVAGLQYNFEKKFTIATIKFSPIIINVGAVPVVFTPQFNIVIGVNGYANASLSSEIGQSLSYNAGMQYLNTTGWSPFQSFTKDFTFQPPSLDMNAGAEVFLKPELVIKLYSIAGPYVNTKIYGKLDANILQTPWWKLYGGVNMDAGIKANILDKFLLDYNISDLIKYEQLLAQASTPLAKLPTVNTSAVTDVTSISANCGGNITNDGGATITVRGVCWGLFENPIIEELKTVDGSGAGQFSSNISSLIMGTTYHVRAYATNSAGTAYGEDVSFKTLGLPSIITSGITSITSSSAISGGNITSNGGLPILESGVCWSTSENPTILNYKTTDGTGSGLFVSNLTNLSANTTYYVRAYATNNLGTSYGDQGILTTTPLTTVIPTVITSNAINITNSSATIGGNITSDGGSTILERGVYWGTVPNPVINGSKLVIENSNASYSLTINSLSESTKYYIIAYAINNIGEAQGDEISFTTNSEVGGNTVTDIDGNIYNTITIGNQVWLKENLKTTKFQDGTDIANITDGTEWANMTTPAFSWYNNDISYKNPYGALYNWYALSNNKGVCPTGWRAPSDEDWDILASFLGGSSIAGSKLKEAGTLHWNSPNLYSNNESGFTAIPTGYRDGFSGIFNSFGEEALLWSTSQPFDLWKSMVYLTNGNEELLKTTYLKPYGLSIRCIKSNTK
ncbi:MAG TPA: fibrobacter succinogenes major paralogous domain-containing protein [Tenuifilaceae bacterium]|nr:fibrobacter succinogenes major paralogous domain-containing protein [Tenuifilaceae bacterium]HPI43785.1 fibrobacter succinogenes major paralogous domain-containing protein [Tenuifilaceae bacterium]